MQFIITLMRAKLVSVYRFHLRSINVVKPRLHFSVLRQFSSGKFPSEIEWTQKKMAMAVGRTQLRSMASPRNIALLGCKLQSVTGLQK
jgi:hypothetical protein